MTFEDFDLSGPVQKRLAELKFETPTPIQEQAIPHVLAGKDVLGKAETGTGKTLAFGLPVIEKVDPGRVAVQALILTPTRELAHQVAESMNDVGVARGIRTATIVGGEPVLEQILQLRKGAQVVVGTPGRVLDLVGQRTLNLGWVEIVVLDEGDRMLDMGFIDDIGKILERTPPERQTLLFSATFPPPLRKIADRYMRDRHEVETSQGLATVSHIEQKFIKVSREDKERLLRIFLDADPGTAYIVFLNRKRDAGRLGRTLWNRGYNVGTIHGDFDQEVRNRVLEQFRNGEVRTLVATDVAQRGLDIVGVSHVINYGVPRDPEDYVHRIGRTGRAGRSGIVLTLVDEDDRRDFEKIQRRTGWKMREVGLPNGLRGWRTDGRSSRGPRGGGGGRGRGGGGRGGGGRGGDSRDGGRRGSVGGRGRERSVAAPAG